MNRLLAAICISAVVFTLGCESTYVYNVPDMMCAEGCGAATHDILAEQSGVKHVKVDFPAKTATVVASRMSFDPENALDELIDHGFENSTIKSSDN